MWSTIYQWELNPPTLYIGYDDPCWNAYPLPEDNKYMDIYFYVHDAWGEKDSGSSGAMSMPGSMPSAPDMPDTPDVPDAPDVPGGMPGGMSGGMGGFGGPTVDFKYGDAITVRIEMEKGKRLNPALMPDNVGTQGATPRELHHTCQSVSVSKL